MMLSNGSGFGKAYKDKGLRDGKNASDVSKMFDEQTVVDAYLKVFKGDFSG